VTVFELMPDDWEPEPDQEQHIRELEENQYEDDCEECGGKQFVTGGNGYYNGHYDCYTLYLECENCGPYEVECV
jgi:hypothetical protein